MVENTDLFKNHLVIDTAPHKRNKKRTIQFDIKFLTIKIRTLVKKISKKIFPASTSTSHHFISLKSGSYNVPQCSKKKWLSGKNQIPTQNTKIPLFFYLFIFFSVFSIAIALFYKIFKQINNLRENVVNHL